MDDKNGDLTTGAANEKLLEATGHDVSAVPDQDRKSADRKSSSAEDDGKSAEARGTWVGKLDFVMSALSFAVGMGNIWRFPYLVYRNGGGAFLLPYLFMVVFAGLPLMFLELSYGQYGRLGVVSIWKAVPLFQGIGWTMFFISFISCMYYNMLIAYSFFYLFASFASDVPWRNCGNWWNTGGCGGLSEMKAEINCTRQNGTWFNQTCFTRENSAPDVYQLVSSAVNHTSGVAAAEKVKSASDEYFHYFMLGISRGIEDVGAPRWHLALCLLLCWILVFVCLSKSIRSFGKATYVTSVFPYVILIILLVRGVTLDGSLEGIIFYLKPDFSSLLKAKVWGDAAVQVFFSMSTCWGGLITLASYNKFNNNCLRDSLVVAFGDCITSIFAGVVIFSIIGYMAHELGVPVHDVVTQGPGLAYIVYPQAVTRLPVSPVWAVLFMLMLINLGIGTQFTLVTTAHTTLLDVWSRQLRQGRRPLLLLAALCLLCFIVGLACTTRGGMYVLQLMDSYAPSYALLFAGFCECVALAWVYGAQRFISDIEEMLGKRVSRFWLICWKFLTPVLIVGILVFTFSDFKRSSYGDYLYPVWADVLGWGITLLEVSFIPGVALYKVLTHTCSQGDLTVLQRIKQLTLPAEDWGKHGDKKSVSSQKEQELMELKQHPV